MAKAKTLKADIAISGGGLVGMTTAIALAHHGLEVVVVEALDAAIVTDPKFDGRASAIAYASKKMLSTIGVWEHLAPYASPILDIRVTDGSSPLFLHFDHSELDDGPLGHMVENRWTRNGLLAAAKGTNNLTVIAPERVERMTVNGPNATLWTDVGTKVQASLVVAAEGRRSPLREAAGIGVRVYPYGQTGIVTSIAHTVSHQNVAHERFLPDGPFAILPLRGEHHSSLVWSVPSDMGEVIMDLNDRALLAEIERRIGGFLGDVSLAGPRWAYPLSLQISERFHAPRLALLGDAARGIHPIAGQGLNLGFRDIAAFVESVVEAKRIGEDIGGEAVLGRYERWRRADSMAFVAFTDGLNRLFSNDVMPVRVARDLGLGAVNRIPPLRRFFMRQARGSSGRLPRLLRGESL